MIFSSLRWYAVSYAVRRGVQQRAMRHDSAEARHHARCARARYARVGKPAAVMPCLMPADARARLAMRAARGGEAYARLLYDEQIKEQAS